MASRSNKSVRYAQPTMASAPKTPPRASIANSVRSAVASRKPQQVLSRQNNSLPDRMDASGNRLGARRQVGEADQATRRAALNAALKPGPAVRAATSQVGQVVPERPLDGSGSGGRLRGKKISDLVDKMQ